MNHKTIIIFVIAGILGIFVAIGIWNIIIPIQGNTESSNSGSPTMDQIRQMCVEKLRGMFDVEPSKLSVNVCVGTVLDGLNNN